MFGFVLVVIIAILFHYYGRKKNPKVLVVEGIIASGKSTFINILKDQLTPFYSKIVVVPEPVDIWNQTGALTNFYADMKGQAYEFQTFVVVTRIKAVLEAYEQNKEADLFIIERSPYTDRYIFGEMLIRDSLISEHQKVKYDLWWNLWMKVWPFKISGILHLCPGVEEAQKRCSLRDRAGEKAVSTEYQEKLLKQHQEFLSSSLCPVPVLPVINVQDLREDSTLQKEICSSVQKFIESL